MDMRWTEHVHTSTMYRNISEHEKFVNETSNNERQRLNQTMSAVYSVHVIIHCLSTVFSKVKFHFITYVQIRLVV